MPNHPKYYFAIYKPYGYLSQFTPDVPGQLTLKDLHDFPPNVYPVGRLDKDSEGLLILTDDTTMNQAMLNPEQKKLKTYWIQVEGVPSDEDLSPLRHTMQLKIRKKFYQLKPAIVHLISTPNVEQRNPPVRVRLTVPDSWLEISISEGKFHQVRKMCASIGFPVLRLIRVQIAGYRLPSLTIGKVWKISNVDDILSGN